MSTRRIVLIGGSSEIGLAIVRALARGRDGTVALVGRDGERLAGAAAELERAGASVAATVTVDAEDTDRHEAALAEAFDALGGDADVVVLAIGRLGERGGVPRDVADAVRVLRVNVVGAGSMLIWAARRLRQQGSGTLIVLSSVAGEKVRRANVVYGASKAGLDGLASGLGDALHVDGVRVLLVRPGFVRTRMTHGLASAPLATDADAVAAAVLRGLDRGAAVVWCPAALRWIMLALRLLPRSLARRLPL